MTKFRKSILAGLAKLQGQGAILSAQEIPNDDFCALHGVMELLSVDVRGLSNGMVKFGHFPDQQIGGYLDIAEQKAVPGRFPLALVTVDDSVSIEIGVLTTKATCFPVTLSFTDDFSTQMVSASNDVELTQAMGSLVSGAKFAEALTSLINHQNNIVRH